MNLGKNILKLRKNKQLSQEQLAEKINVTRQTISNWELGETSPNPEQLKLLSKELDISIDELLGNDRKTILEEKISNTEKLAGMIIKILKFLGIFCIVIFIIEVIALIAFSVIRPKTTVESVVDSASITCSIKEKDYLIDVGSDAYFNCSNCSKKIQQDVKRLIDYSDIEKSIQNIENYFNDNGGICD